MTGVPAGLDLDPFVGAALIQLGVGEFQVQFLFQRPETPGADGTLYLGVEGDWELHDAGGEIVDRGGR